MLRPGPIYILILAAICGNAVNRCSNLRGIFSEFRSLKFPEQTVMSENKIFSNGHQVRKIQIKGKQTAPGGFTI